MTLTENSMSRSAWREAFYAGAEIPENPEDTTLTKAQVKSAIAVCEGKIETIQSGGLGEEFEEGQDEDWIAELTEAAAAFSDLLEDPT